MTSDSEIAETIWNQLVPDNRASLNFLEDSTHRIPDVSLKQSLIRFITRLKSKVKNNLLSIPREFFVHNIIKAKNENKFKLGTIFEKLHKSDSKNKIESEQYFSGDSLMKDDKPKTDTNNSIKLSLSASTQKLTSEVKPILKNYTNRSTSSSPEKSVRFSDQKVNKNLLDYYDNRNNNKIDNKSLNNYMLQNNVMTRDQIFENHKNNSNSVNLQNTNNFNTLNNIKTKISDIRDQINNKFSIYEDYDFKLSSGKSNQLLSSFNSNGTSDFGFSNENNSKIDKSKLKLNISKIKLKSPSNISKNKSTIASLSKSRSVSPLKSYNVRSTSPIKHTNVSPNLKRVKLNNKSNSNSNYNSNLNGENYNMQETFNPACPTHVRQEREALKECTFTPRINESSVRPRYMNYMYNQNNTNFKDENNKSWTESATPNFDYIMNLNNDGNISINNNKKLRVNKQVYVKSTADDIREKSLERNRSILQMRKSLHQKYTKRKWDNNTNTNKSKSIATSLINNRSTSSLIKSEMELNKYNSRNKSPKMDSKSPMRSVRSKSPVYKPKSTKNAEIDSPTRNTFYSDAYQRKLSESKYNSLNVNNSNSKGFTNSLNVMDYEKKNDLMEVRRRYFSFV